MKYRFTILNVPAFVFILAGTIFTTLNYRELLKDEGWGVVGMLTLFVCSIFVLIVDLLIQRLITSRINRIKLSMLVLLAILVSLFFK